MVTLKNPVAFNDHRQGNAEGAIVLVEYGDYQCSHCAKAHQAVKQLQNYFGEDLSFVYRHFSLVEIHPMAKAAAEAAECAADHNRFWEMHDLIFENQESLRMTFLFDLAAQLELPIDELKIALGNHSYVSKIKNDFLEGVRSGVNGTPTFFINGERHNGSYQFEELSSAIEAVLAK